MSDFVLFLSLLYRWIFGDSAFVLGRASEKEKKQERQVGFKGRYIFLKIWFLTNFMKVIDIFKNGVIHINLVNIQDMIFF